MASILKVNTIQDATNSNTAMSIDSSGRILTPARPTLFADCDNGSSAGYDTIGNFSTVPYRNVISGSGISLNTSTYVFTIPITGFYQINATILNNNAEDLEIAMTVGGSTESKVVQRGYANSDNRSCYLHHAMELQANDECRILNTSGGNRGFHRNTNANDRYTSLSVYLIG